MTRVSSSSLPLSGLITGLSAFALRRAYGSAVTGLAVSAFLDGLNGRTGADERPGAAPGGFIGVKEDWADPGRGGNSFPAAAAFFPAAIASLRAFRGGAPVKFDVFLDS